MSQGYEFYEARASEATVEAGKAQLDNVRDRALRSAAAWTAMADRARKIEEERTARQLAKTDAHEPVPAGEYQLILAPEPENDPDLWT